MKKIILLISLLFFDAMGQSFDPAAEVYDNWESRYSEDLTDQRVHNTTLPEVEESNADSTYKQTWEDNRAGKVLKEKVWFKDVAMTSCETPADYACPSLLDIPAKEGYRVRLNSIDLTSGRLNCSVLDRVEFGASLTSESEKPLFNKTFINKACVQKYSTVNPENKDTNESIVKLKQENALFLEGLKQQEFKYTVDYKKSGEDEFLDLADILDGLVSFNPEIFNLEETLLTRDLKTRTGYTVLPNDTIVENFSQSMKNLWDIIDGEGLGSDRFYEEQKVQARIRDASAAVANSSYFMLLDFWLKSNDLMVDIAIVLAFLFGGYSILATWVMPALTNKMQKKDSGENTPQRGIYGFMLLIMLFAGDVEKLNVEYESKSEGLAKTELIVQQTNLQALIQLLYSETNWVADSFAEVGTRAFLNSMNASTGLFDGAQIDAMATESVILNKESDKLEQIDSDMCVANFDTKLIVDKLIAYRSKTGDDKNYNFYDWKSQGTFLDRSAEISPLRANRFPKSEREAQAMMYASGAQGNISPYNSSMATRESGVVKKDAANKFRGGDNSELSLSGCYLNKKKMIENESRLRGIQAQFDKLKDEGTKEAKVEYLRVVNEIQWGLFAKQGYLSIAYLPATAMLIDNIGIVGDLEAREESIRDASGGSEENLLTDGGTMLFKSLAEDIPYLAMFGGYSIAKMVHPVKDFLLDGFINVVSKGSGPIGTVATTIGSKIYDLKDGLTFGDEESEIDVLDLWIAAKLVQNIFTTMITVVLITGSILIFTLLFIEKLFAFIASMFLLIYAFSKNQEERIATAVSKIFAIAFKTVLIVVCVFLAMYSLHLVGSLEMIFVESFFKSMDMLENASWTYIFSDISEVSMSQFMTVLALFFKKYIFFGVTKFAFAMLKLVLVVQMIWKMPGYMYELIYEKVHSVSDSVGETLQSTTDAQTMRV